MINKAKIISMFTRVLSGLILATSITIIHEACIADKQYNKKVIKVLKANRGKLLKGEG